MSFIITADSTCDLSPQQIKDNNIGIVPLHIELDGKEYLDDLGQTMTHRDFYNALRNGASPSTSQVNSSEFLEFFTPFLEQGKDILQLCFSSGLSGSYHAAKNAAAIAAERYPERKIYAVDSLCASLGQGLLIYHAWQEKQKGKTIEEVRDFTEANKLHLCHWFTIDDLMFLKRGGRISGATAIVGSMLNIKPVMHVDDEGHLIKVGTARGRKASLRALADEAGKRGVDLENQVIFISHGDCQEDADYLGDLMKERYHVKDVKTNFVGPVIGTHSGPGTVALFFVGTER